MEVKCLDTDGKLYAIECIADHDPTVVFVKESDYWTPFSRVFIRQPGEEIANEVEVRRIRQ